MSFKGDLSRPPKVNDNKSIRDRVGALFLVADESERKGESWWCVYIAGVRAFASTDEAEADNFRNRLHTRVLETMGLR